MAIEVRIPTILRTYTDGEKAVSAQGDTLAGLIDDLEANHPGIKERLGQDEDPRRVGNVQGHDGDGRFIGGPGAQGSPGRQGRGVPPPPRR